MQKRSYHFLTELSLQSQTYFQRRLKQEKENQYPKEY